MDYILVKDNKSTAVSIDEAKRQLGRFDDMDDLHIDLVIHAAIDMAEAYTDRFYSRKTLKANVTEAGEYTLPKSDNINVLSATDSDGNVAYSVDEFNNCISVDKPCVVEYETGLSVMPLRVKMAVLRVVSDLYQHREDDVFGAVKSKVSVTAYDALDSVKRVAI